MFRALPRPSSGAYNCISNLWFYRWSLAVASLLVVVCQTTTNNAATATHGLTNIKYVFYTNERWAGIAQSIQWPVYRLKDRRNLSSFADNVRKLSVLQNFRTSCCVHLASSVRDITVKTAEAWHWPLSTNNSEKKNASTFVFTPPPYAFVWCVGTTWHLAVSMFMYYQSLLFINKCTSDYLKNYIKIYIKISPTYFGAVTPSSRSSLSMLAEVTLC
jgi:hypothetical protein